LESLAEEAYNLVKHCNFTYQDVKTMTGEERNEFIMMLVDERKRENEEIEKLKT